LKVAIFIVDTDASAECRESKPGTRRVGHSAWHDDPAFVPARHRTRRPVRRPIRANRAGNGSLDWLAAEPEERDDTAHWRADWPGH
jgi:hypothetical protein